MTSTEIVFWTCALLVLYPYVLYPLMLAGLARLFGKPILRATGQSRSISFLLCAYNEQLRIERRLRELLTLVEKHPAPAEIIVVCDGCTDDTAAFVRRHTSEIVRLIELPERVGKSAALSQAASLARHEILLFADVRQQWQGDAVERLLENFNDPTIGAVSGELVVTSGPGAMSGVGIYWRYEKWLRCTESRLGSQVGVTGAISACRRELFRPIPAGTVLDDVYWPLAVVMQGKRVIHDRLAIAHDRLPERACDEFRRKVRTLAGNYQLALTLPGVLLPWRNPVWWQFCSHKFARLVVPWALIGLFFTSLLAGGWFYGTVLGLQVFSYLLALIGLLAGRSGRLGGWVAAAAASFLMLNVAAWIAFWVWSTGRTSRSWGKVSYDKPPRGRLAEVAGSQGS